MTPTPEGSAVPDPEPAGEVVGRGRYVVVGSLGAGAQGETLEAVDKREGRPVAIKRFTLRGAKSWKDVELAEREATVLAALSHPSLPRYIEHFEEDGALYLVMEKVEGESLAARRRRKQPLSHEQVLRFLRDSATSLAYLHGHAPPIVHRDIKPGNVILRPDGSYCLVDFGSVRDSLKPEGGSTVVGTFGFMAPEQFQGRASPVSDVYSVGATALCLLTGQEPENLPHKGLAIDVERALAGQVDRRLLSALRSMVEPDPERRVPSVEQALRIAGLTQTTQNPSAEAVKQARRARVAADQAFRRTEESASHYGSQYDRHREREARRAVERAARQERKRARRAERHAHHYTDARWHGPRRTVPPGVVLGIALLLALQLANIATFALFQVLLPTLFALLGMPRRRERMLDIARAGHTGLRTASEHIRHQLLGGPAPPGYDALFEQFAPNAPTAATPHSRVASDAEAEAEAEARAAEAEARAAEAEAEAEAEARAAEAARASRRR